MDVKASRTCASLALFGLAAAIAAQGCAGASTYVIDLEPPLTRLATGIDGIGYVELYNGPGFPARQDTKHATGFAAGQIYELRQAFDESPCPPADSKIVELIKAEYQAEKVCPVGTLDKSHRREGVYRRRIATSPGFHMYAVIARSKPQKIDVDIEMGHLTAVRVDIEKLAEPEPFLGADVYFGVKLTATQPLPFRGPEAVGSLTESLKSSDWSVRWMAVYLLGNLQARSVVDQIKAVSRQDPNKDVMKIALRVYEELKPARGSRKR